MSKGQSLFVPLGGGLDTGIDDKLLPVGKVPTLSNCVIDRSGEVVKRGGVTALSAAVTPAAPGSGALVGSSWQLATYKTSLVSLQRSGSDPIIADLSPAASAWSRVKDPATSSDAALSSAARARVGHSLIPVTSDLSVNTTPDVAYSSGLFFSCYSDSTGHAVLRVIDASTSRAVYTWRTIDRGLGPRVIVSANGYLCMFYRDDANTRIKCDAWLISSAFGVVLGTPSTTVVATAIENAAAPYVFFDVINLPSGPTGATATVCLAYRTNAATTFRADFRPATATITANVEIKTSGGVSINAITALNWVVDLGGSGKLGFVSSGGPLQVQWDLPAGSGTPSTTYVLDAAPGANVRTITGHTISSASSGEVFVIVDTYDNTQPTYTRRLRLCSRTIVDGITAREWIRSIGLTSKTIAYGGDYYAIVNYESGGSPQPLQSSYFLVRVPASNPSVAVTAEKAPQARIALWNSAGNPTSTVRSHPSSIAIVSGTKFAAAINVFAGTLNLTQGSGAGVQVAALTFDPTLGPAREAADALYVPGGVLSSFGGLSYEEDGFSIYPEQPTHSIAAGGALTANATYRYQIVYTFIDENGRKHRSTPSVPVDIELFVTPFLSTVPVFLATLVPLPACTAVGSGPGKYLIETAPSGTGVSIDGVRALEGALVLVQSQVTTKDNGVYTVTNSGLPPSAWQLTRSPLFDGSAAGPVNAGAVIGVRNDSAALNGFVNRGKQFALQGAGPFTVDTTALTFSAVSASQTINLTIPTLRLTNRTVTIEVYRTQANNTGGILTLAGTVANDTTVDTVAFSDAASDASIAASEAIYTTGGVLSSDPSPGFSYVFVAKNRLWGLSMDNPAEAWFTNEFLPSGEAPRWNEERIVSVADEHGALIAGSGLNDKVVLFKGDAIYVFAGEGPNEIGQGGFGDVQLVSAGVGATNPQSIAATKDGVFFESSSTNVKIKMLDRSLSIEDIGAPVRAFDPIPIIAAGFIPVLDQIRFYLGIKTALVYDVVEKQWSTFAFTDAAGSYVHGVPWNGTFATATSTPSILTEDQSGSVWSDSGNVYPMSIWSPWIQLSGIKGFSRLKKIQGVGVNRAVGVASLDVVLLIDFASAVAGHYTGKPGITWNWEMIPRTQRGSAFQVQLTEASITAGFKVSGVTMLIGTKQGLSRQAASTRLVGQ